MKGRSYRVAQIWSDPAFALHRAGTDHIVDLDCCEIAPPPITEEELAQVYKSLGVHNET